MSFSQPSDYHSQVDWISEAFAARRVFQELQSLQPTSIVFVIEEIRKRDAEVQSRLLEVPIDDQTTKLDELEHKNSTLLEQNRSWLVFYSGELIGNDDPFDRPVGEDDEDDGW